MAQLRREVSKLKGTLEITCHGRTTDVSVDSPAGMVWNANDCHVLIGSWDGSPTRPTWTQDKRDSINDIKERISYGLSECTDPECEYCHTNQE